MTLQADEVQITANDRYSGNDRFSGMKSPDRFFHYSGRCLYLVLGGSFDNTIVSFQSQRNVETYLSLRTLISKIFIHSLSICTFRMIMAIQNVSDCST